MKHLKTGITFGIIGGFLTFLFGGWSVAVIGSLMGIGLGLGLGGKFERRDPLKIALTVLPTALVAGVLLVALSYYQNSAVMDAVGKRPAAADIVFKANLIGFLGAVLFTALLASLSGLPEKQERMAKFVLLALLVIVLIK